MTPPLLLVKVLLVIFSEHLPNEPMTPALLLLKIQVAILNMEPDISMTPVERLALLLVKVLYY